MTLNKHSVSFMLLQCSLNPNFHKLWYMHRMKFYFNHLKCEAVLHVFMWNDCHDIISIYGGKKGKKSMYSTSPLLFFFTTDIYKYICVYICTHTHTHTHRYIYTQRMSPEEYIRNKYQ